MKFMSDFPFPQASLHPAVFDPAAGNWVPAPPARPEAPPAIPSFSVATWNVWFGEVELAARGRALLSVLEPLRPDFICLQEVTRPFLRQVLATPWIRDAYQISDATGATLGGYGVLMLSRAPFSTLRLLELPSGMERKLLVGEVATAEGPLRVGTVHLESTRHCTEERVEQIRWIQPVLLEGDHDVVWCGDFNFDPAVHPLERAATDARWTDTWIAAAPPRAPGYTVDTEANAMRAAFSTIGERKQRRIDRILLSSPRRAVSAIEARLLGDAPIAPSTPLVFPSDHFGLFARFTRRAS